MAIKVKSIICLAFLLPMITCSCNTSFPKNDLPDITVPQEQINKDFELSTPKSQNTFKIGDEIVLEIKVISRNQIWFPRDSGARIYIYEKGHWLEVVNSENYEYLPPEGYLCIPFDNHYFNIGIAEVVPQIPDIKKMTIVRIFLIGNIYKNGQITEDKTAGYIDVRLWP